MKIAKKTLSVFLAFLMLFSACSVGLTGVVSFAAENNSKYSADEVVALINKAIANGYSAKSSAGKTNITGDDGSVINAAEAIYDYAIKNYRTSKKANASYNATTTICAKFISDFTGKFSGTTAQNAMKALATDVLNPSGGTTIYAYESRKSGTQWTKTNSYATTSTSKEYPITNQTDAESTVKNNNLFNSSVSQTVITQTVNVTVDLEKLLLAYDKISDIPTTLITDISYTYSHAFGYSVSLSNTDGSTGSGTKKKDTRTSTITNESWNYMSGKPVRLITKDKTVKKQLVAFEKYFTQETLNMTLEDMLAIPLADLAEEVTLATGYADAIEETFSDTILTHFKLDPAKISAYVENLKFAYSVVAGMDAIDTLLANIEALRNEDTDGDGVGDGYNVDSYAEMASLYTKANSAFGVVSTMQDATADYIVGEMGYAQEYADVQAILAETQSLLTVLHDIMTEQRFEELIASMTAKYDQYYDKLDKEDFETPTDDEVMNLAQQKAAWDAILDEYRGVYSYYNTYFPETFADTDEVKKLDQAEWADFEAKLKEVVEARDLRIDYEENFYNFFYPILYTTAIVDLDDDGAMALYEEFNTRLEEARTYYNDIVAKYGNYVIADNIFLLTYEGSEALLHTHVENSKTAGLQAVKDNLVDRAEADIDAVYSYKNVTTVDFTNFAEIKSTISHFNQDLYDYVTGGNRDSANWLSTDYQNKYAELANLINKYHAFTTTNGKSSYDALKANFGYSENGIYATRVAGSRTVEVTGEDDDGNPVTVEQQIGYPNDLVRDGAEDDYVVDKALLEQTVVKLDKFIASRDFGALLGFVDEDTEEAATLNTYVQQMLNNSLFTSDLLNSLIAMIYPMVCDLLETELPKALADLGTPNDPGASAAIDVSTLTSALGGTLNVYIDDDEKTIDDNWNGRNQRYLYEVFESAELYIYPRSFAKYLNISNPAIFYPGNELYDALMTADRSWKYFELQEDLLDEEGEVVAEAGTIHIDYDWNINGDREAFLEGMSYILDSILPLLETLMLGTTFSEELNNAAYVWGYADVPILGDQQLGGYGNLTLNITSADANGNAYSVWNSVIVPLFRVLGVAESKIPTLKAGFSGEDISNALLGTLLDRVDEILASPIDNVLSILPNLVYFISMDSVQEILNNINININLGIGVVINSDDSGAIGDILGWLGNDAFDFLDNLTSFDLGLAISDLVDLYDMLGFEISDFNDILGALTADMGLNLPKIKQQDIILCSTWSTFSNGDPNLIADKAEILYWLLSFVVEAIQGGLLDSLLGSSDEPMDPTLKALLDKIVYQFSQNTDDAVAGIIELLNPTTYDLEGMEWIEQGAWDYNGIEGTNQMSIVYLNYGNDWTRADAEYLVNNVDSIVKTVLDMANVEIGDLGTYLKDMLNGLFTNENITKLVEMLGGLGDSPSGVILDVVANQIGIDIESWFVAFGYLYPAETWADDAEVIRRDSQFYVNNFGVEGIKNDDGTITWTFNRMPLNDGDGYTFINILTRLLGGMDLAIKFLFAGADISAFENVLTIKGYETYDNTFGLLLTMLGVENLPTQEDFVNDTMGSFTNMLYAILDWFYALTDSGNMIAQLMEVIPDVFYYIESNGLSTLLKNLLMPVLVLVDTVRPLFDVDLNGVLSYLVSDLLNYSTVDMDGLLQVLVYGNNPHFADLDYMWYSLDINNLTLSSILTIVDKWLGTDLYSSGLVQIGLKGLCSGVQPATGAIGNYYRTTVDAADTITILVTAFIDCLAYPAQDKSKTNGDVVFEFIAEMAEKPELAGLYGSISEILAGIDYEYDFPNWGYMFAEGDVFTPDNLPEQSIVYLGYTTDWDKEAADGVYGALDTILDMVLPSILKDNADLAELLNGVLNDNVYTDKNLNTIVEGLVGLLANLDATLFELVDVVVDTDITAWFTMCDITEDADGKKVVTCNVNWGVDAAAEADKKDVFVAGIKTVLAPANSLLSWLFFGTEYSFFTSSEVDADGDYTFADLITLKGGEGYAYGLVPLLEALGCTMQPAEAFYDAATGTYDVGAAVGGILDSVLELVDDISANPVEEVFNLLPNLIYFINADGAKVVVNNLIAPVNAILEKLSPVVGDVSLGGLLADTLGFDITDIDMDTLLGIADANGVVLNDTMVAILSNLYVGKLAEFTSANGTKAYKLDITGYEGDVLTIVLSLAIDVFKLNETLFAPLMGAENYAAIITLLGGLDFEKNYLDMNWAYMYDGDLDKLNNDGFPEQTIEYLGYTTDWDEATAAGVYGALDDILDLVLPSLLEDNEDLAALVDGILNDNVYTEQNLNTIVEALVGLLVGLDSALYEGVGALLDADISTWFNMCEITEVDGKTVVTCTKEWGFDEATDKKAAFVAGIKEVLAPANKVLSWLFFGEQFTLLNGTTSEVLVTLNGGQGYAYGLVPIFEALGCKMKPASDFYNATTKTYDVGAAVEGILDAALGLVDKISANPIDEVFTLLPNLIYFINAGGLKASVNNLLAPVNAVLDCLSGLVGDISIGSLLADAIGMDICNLSMDTLLDFAASYDFIINEDMAYVLKNLYVGVPTAFDSASGRTAYAVAYDAGNPAHEMLTILLSFALEAFTINETLFAPLLGKDIYWAVRNLIKGVADEFTYLDLNWAYMYEGETNADKMAALKAALNEAGTVATLPARTNAAYDVYTLYQNNWNKATADYVTLVLDKLVHDITTAVRSDGSSLGQILDQAIADGLYQDSLLNDLVSMVVELLLDYEDIVKGAGALLGAESLVNWFTYCEITEDENGDTVVTCTKDWGIDKAETIDAKRTAFIDAFATVLEPAYDLLAWLFFAEDYTFFSATTGEPLITLTGGKGYEEAFIPLFEAVGVLMKKDADGKLLSVEDTYLKGESAVLPASYFYNDAGDLDMKLAVTTIFGAVSDWLYDICGDLGDQSGDGALTSMLERLPNVLYSINADGLVAVVNNLTAPLMHLLDNLGAFGVDLDINGLIGIEGMDIFNFQFDDLFALLADEDVLGLYFPDYTQEFLKSFYIGELRSYRSANGSEAYFMTYSEEETAAEMITCLIGFVVDAFQDPRNPAILIDWMGEDVYNGIMAVLGITEVKEMQDFSWMYKEYADTDYEFNATESSVRYDVAYNTIWTRDKAEYISKNLIPFVNNILGLIGLELDGYEVKNVDDLIDSLLNGKLYTAEMATMLLDLIRDLVGKLTSLEPYGEYIIGILDKAFGVNLAAWDSMSFNFADGDKAAFVAALGEIIAPVVPLLDVLLCGENIELFYSIAPEKVGESALIIYGSEGYAYGIVPLFEALGCTMPTPDAFKALSDADKASALIDALLARIDVIAADPVTEIFKMIPELVYFINSNGLDTAVNNILNSVDTVLIALEPLLGATSLMELLGVDLAEYNMDYLINLACEAISESTGLDCEALILDFVAELTMGKVVSYTSANGETYYKMVFANEEQMTDMVTVILRLLIDFLATGGNADAIIALIANNSESEEAANSASTLINFVLTAANTEPVTSGAMATLYYLFYGLNEGVAGIDTLYGNYGESWNALVGFFEETEESYMVKAAEVLKAILKEIGGVDTESSVPDCDCDCHNNSGFVRFFFKIITFLRKLFGMKQFQICDCGAAHW